MPLLVKVCGLNSPEAVDAAVEEGADLVGFVCFERSPRHLDQDRARALGRRVAGGARKVALTVDAADAVLAAFIEVLEPDLLQLHGAESPERVAAIREQFRLPVIKAIGVEDAADLRVVPRYAEVADYLLFDARPPRDATRPGGHGIRFDWSLLQEFDPGVAYLLSGGLDPDNVAAALALTRAAGVDVSSGVERAPGEKDPERIRAFIRAARQAVANASSWGAA
jgi:phosphoribosylanthranilate isomerase